MQENSVYTEDGLRPKSEFTQILLTPNIPLPQPVIKKNILNPEVF